MSIQQWEDRSAVTLATTQDIAVQRLGEWAQSADAAYQVAERLAGSAFVPAQFKNKPVELTAAILSGLEVGLSPMAAMRSFDIISGQAAPRAITLRAVVQSHGHEMVLVESTSSRCRMKGKRKGSDEWQSVTWDMSRAQGLGLTGKDNWKKQPGAMLLARATSELARLIASDAILGIGYSSEEVADGGGEAPVDVAPATGTRKMSRPSMPSQTSDPDPVTANTAESPELPATGEDQLSGSESPLLTSRTSFGKAFYARMAERSFPSDEARIEYVVETIGRFVTSTKEISEDEARKVLARLDDEETVDAEVVS
jgi:hypothetical protein